MSSWRPAVLSMTVFLLVVNLSAHSAEELRKELKSISTLLKGRNTNLAMVDERGGELLKKYPEPRDQGQIYYLLAHVYAQSGLQKPEKVIEYAQQALSRPLDVSHKMRLYVYWGDALQIGNPKTPFPSKRKAAAVPYLKGLKELQPYQLPEKAPELPGVFRYTMSPNDPDYEKVEREHEQAMAARRDAELKADLVMHRDVLTKQVVALYSRRPYATEELRNLASEIGNDPATVERLTEAVRSGIPKAEQVRAKQTGAKETPPSPEPPPPATSPVGWYVTIAIASILVGIAAVFLLRKWPWGRQRRRQ